MISYLFQPYIYYFSSDFETEELTFKYQEIKSVLFIYNAQLYLILAIFCIFLFVIVPIASKKARTSNKKYDFIWFFVLNSCMDITTYGCLNLKHAYSDDYLMTISLIISILFIAANVSSLVLLISSILSRKLFTYLKYFFVEFKSNSRFKLLYYPIFIFTRLLFGALLVFAYNYQYFQVLTIIIVEVLCIIFIVASLPFRST